MSVQSNTLGRRLDVYLDLYNSLEGESTAKLEIKERDVVVDSFDTNCVNTMPLVMERTYVSGKVLRSAAAMVVIDLLRSVIEGTNNVEQPCL